MVEESAKIGQPVKLAPPDAYWLQFATAFHAPFSGCAEVPCFPNGRGRDEAQIIRQVIYESFPGQVVVN